MSTLDWHVVAPEQRFHQCDCDHCELVMDPVQWPMLVPIQDGDVRYVTDRYLAIREDHAPIPAGWEGVVHSGEDGPSIPASWRVPITDEAPVGVHFRHQTMQAIETCGWRLRKLQGDITPHHQAPKETRLHAVVTQTDEHIGWAISAKPVAVDDEYATAEWTRPYAETSADSGAA